MLVTAGVATWNTGTDFVAGVLLSYTLKRGWIKLWSR
jgi:hypothetical protein